MFFGCRSQNMRGLQKNVVVECSLFNIVPIFAYMSNNLNTTLIYIMCNGLFKLVRCLRVLVTLFWPLGPSSRLVIWPRFVVRRWSLPWTFSRLAFVFPWPTGAGSLANSQEAVVFYYPHRITPIHFGCTIIACVVRARPTLPQYHIITITW